MMTRSLIFLVVTGLLYDNTPEQAVEKTAKFVMNRIGTAHHVRVDLIELLV